MDEVHASIALSDYAAAIEETDVLDPHDLTPVLQGLYGEVGGVMAAAKKHVRERDRYPGYGRAVVDEFGDALWYLAAVCRRVGVELAGLFDEATSGGGYTLVGIASDMAGGACAKVAVATSDASLDARLFKLGQSAAALLCGTPDRPKLVQFTRDYLEALSGAKVAFSEVARSNLRKARGAFVEPKLDDLKDFDRTFLAEEKLPYDFAIQVTQRASGKTYLQWNGVFIGDSLTDNILDPDGYRFHDVFHFANAAILHWSPVVRALIKHKRKSDPVYDEAQDGGRAIVVEEGLTAWIFTQAKDLNFFEGHTRVSLGILKTIGDFVRGFEVDECPLKLWERSILQGYEVFRQVRKAEGGWIIGDRTNRTLTYRQSELQP